MAISGFLRKQQKVNGNLIAQEKRNALCRMLSFVKLSVASELVEGKLNRKMFQLKIFPFSSLSDVFVLFLLSFQVKKGNGKVCLRKPKRIQSLCSNSSRSLQN